MTLLSEGQESQQTDIELLLTTSLLLGKVRKQW